MTRLGFRRIDYAVRRMMLLVFLVLSSTVMSTVLECEAWTILPSSVVRAPQIRVSSCSSSVGGFLFQQLSSSTNDEDELLSLELDEDDEYSSFQLLEDRTNSTQEKDQFSFCIKNCQYADLNAASDIIMASFYDDKVSWRRFVKLAELNRLQQNFPYGATNLHQMLVAVLSSPSSNGERVVVGFVDIDARPCKTEIPLPRPYLSDLAVDPKYRRRGIAQALIERCENFIKDIPKPELYIRVAETNEAALAMYTNKLHYKARGTALTTDKKKVITLHKSFVEETEEEEEWQALEAEETSELIVDSSSNDETDYVI
jgi:ribosomal protein S18 acetylase RimI-like enzyme